MVLVVRRVPLWGYEFPPFSSLCGLNTTRALVIGYHARAVLPDVFWHARRLHQG